MASLFSNMKTNQNELLFVNEPEKKKNNCDHCFLQKHSLLNIFSSKLRTNYNIFDKNFLLVVELLVVKYHSSVMILHEL